MHRWPRNSRKLSTLPPSTHFHWYFGKWHAYNSNEIGRKRGKVLNFIEFRYHRATFCNNLPLGPHINLTNMSTLGTQTLLSYQRVFLTVSFNDHTDIKWKEHLSHLVQLSINNHIYQHNQRHRPSHGCVEWKLHAMWSKHAYFKLVLLY